MTKSTGIQQFICMGMMRLCIENKCGACDAKAVDAFMDAMSYRDWESILDDSSLSKGMASGGVKDVPAVIAQAKRTLVEKQSLFTMSAR